MEKIRSIELRQMQSLSQEVAALSPALSNSEATVGELAWVWAKDFDLLGHFWHCRLWIEENRVQAWAWLCQPHKTQRPNGTLREQKHASLRWQTHPDRAELLDEVLYWYDEAAGPVQRHLIVQSADQKSQDIVAAHGYLLDEEASGDAGDWIQLNARELTDPTATVLPEGFRFLSAKDVSAEAAVQAHRDAWHPSSFCLSDFARVQKTWPYRTDLHVMIEAPDGSLVASAIIWLDPLSQSAEFEPVGTHRDYRRRGLGRALQLYGMQLAKAAGAKLMLVACIGTNSDPAARKLYESVGFRPLTRDLPQVKSY